MNRVALCVVLLGIFNFAAIPSGHAGSKRAEAARATWEALKKAIADHQENDVQTFVGRTILLTGGLETYRPPLRLTTDIGDGNWFQIQIVPPRRNSRADMDVTRILKWKAALVEAELTGVVRSIDLTKKVILLEVISGNVGAAT